MENKLAKNKTINIIGAILFTFLTFGLGQISCGKIRRGIIIYVLSFIVGFLAIYICTRPIPPFNIIIATIIFVGLYLFVLIDAFLISRNPKNTLKINPLIGYLLIVGIWQLNSSFITPTIAKIVKEDFVQAYQIPSGGMIPTLLVGDHLLVDKHIYKNQAPSYGDIVIFPYPVDPKKGFIMRVVALGGDTIEIKEKQVYLNGKELSEPYAVHLAPQIIQDNKNPRDFFGPVTVPEDSIFVLGDNRDNSHDSRYWGFVKKETVEARVINLYWSWDKKEGKVRWDRIGRPIT